MKKTDLVEIMQRSATQLVLLSVVFVSMVMVFLIPSLDGEAEAKIDAQAFAPPGTTFTDLQGIMLSGKFYAVPNTILGGTLALWEQ